MDLGVGGISFFQWLIFYELWAGGRFDEISLFATWWALGGLCLVLLVLIIAGSVILGGRSVVMVLLRADSRCSCAAAGRTAGALLQHRRAQDLRRHHPAVLVDRDLRHPQIAEQLVEVPTELSFASLQQQTAEQNVDIFGTRGRGGSGGGGLYGFLPGQS